MTMYISALLIALVDCGLVEALVDLGQEQVEDQQDLPTTSQSECTAATTAPTGGSTNALTSSAGGSSAPLGIGFKSTILLGDLLQMSPSLLPRVQVARLQAGPPPEVGRLGQ